MMHFYNSTNKHSVFEILAKVHSQNLSDRNWLNKRGHMGGVDGSGVDSCELYLQTGNGLLKTFICEMITMQFILEWLPDAL